MLHKKILYVEDDEDDRELFLDAVSKLNPSVKVIMVENGLAALEFLDSIQKQPAEFPCLLVLDINMPVLDGIETLKRIRSIPELDSLAIIIYTSSKNPRDKEQFLQQGTPIFTKPTSFKEMNNVIQHMLDVCDQNA